MANKQITVPDIGDAGDVEVIELLVKIGDTVAKDDSLLVLESDKAAMEIPSPFAGIITSIEVNLGDQVSTGSPIMTVETADAGAETKTSAGAEAGAVAATAATAPAPATAANSTAVGSEPVVAKTDAATSPNPAEPPPPATTPAASSMEVNIPELGTDDEVEVIEIHVKPGDSVAVDDPLITLESDKAAMDVPATEAGEVEQLLLAIGDKVKTGSPILRLKTSGSVAAANPATPAPAAVTTAEVPASSTNSPAAAPPKAPSAFPETEPTNLQAAPASGSPTQPGSTASPEKIYAGPAVRKLARELGVDLAQVPGTGARGRLIKEDVHEFVKARINAPAGGGAALAAAVPDIDFSQFGEIETVKRSKLHRVTAVNMQRNWQTVPHVAQFNEADITDLDAFRAELKPEAERRGTKLTFLPFLLKACAHALQTYPQFNVSLHSSGEFLIQKKYIHIGMAVATDAGLLVPVIRDVDKKSLWELAEEVLLLSAKARDRKLSIEDMQGACFTISSLGAIGGTGFIPIINAPEVAILGVAKTVTKPVFIDGEFKPRQMLPLTLSYDHQAVNGVDGGLFSTHLVKLLGDIRHLIT